MNIINYLVTILTIRPLTYISLTISFPSKKGITFESFFAVCKMSSLLKSELTKISERLLPLTCTGIFSLSDLIKSAL